MDRIDITSNLSQDELIIHGDKNDLEMLFINIFQNCVETAGEKRADIQVLATHDNSSAPFIEIEIVNRGFYAGPEEIQNAFVPFYSSKPDGTGFGLSIARLAARKNLGDIYLESLPQQGVRYLVKLPALVKENREGTEP
jgi:signal transduction histidine kinase